jgi:hypothetical protein
MIVRSIDLGILHLERVHAASAIRSRRAPLRAQPIGRFVRRPSFRFNRPMAPRFMTILTGHNLPKIRQARAPEPSIINTKTIADFTRVVEQTGILGCRSGLVADEQTIRAPDARPEQMPDGY